MPNISDLIEAYLKKMLEQSPKGYIEIQRNELAGEFNCVPSQINYVLSTRFTVNHGFVIESRRGGGGYVRISKVPLESGCDWLEELYRLMGNSVTQSVATGILQRLLSEEKITKREFKIMKAAVDRSVLKIELPWRDKLRAQILKAMITAVAGEKK
ncbi:transcriptional regulator CtsR [Desulfohalotomaculum tongense]|uniref:CtsR family transcriptional regulator n=1 Tax=Desulforadius tongensis TaxID=1216062 RepID=UPI0019567B1C|nr:CtsR family transcriptional regulator [Desulforadius tongensis]MBM7853791.1 transcriptional regulator CtsR [Desulforadius tongensis]